MVAHVGAACQGCCTLVERKLEPPVNVEVHVMEGIGGHDCGSLEPSVDTHWNGPGELAS